MFRKDSDEYRKRLVDNLDLHGMLNDKFISPNELAMLMFTPQANWPLELHNKASLFAPYRWDLGEGNAGLDAHQ